MGQKQKPLWTALFALSIFGFALFHVYFVMVVLVGAGYLFFRPGIRQKALWAIEKGDWGDLFEALAQPGSPPPPHNSRRKVKPLHAWSDIFKNFFPMNFPLRKLALPAVLGLITILIILDGIVSVPAGHVGVLFDRGRGVLKNELDEGIHLKIPFWQTAVMMNTRLQTYTMSTNLSEADLINNTKALQLQSLVGSSESAIRSYALRSNTTNNSIDALTKDGQRVTVDLTVQFQIDGDNASEIYRTIGLNYVDKVVRPAARSITREKVTGFTSKELYNESTRQAMEQDIEAAMQTNFGNKNVILGDILIRHIGFSQSYLNAIEEKQIAQQKIEKAEFEKQEAEIRKEKTIIEAQAEAESIKLKGEALSQSPEVIQLQFVEKMAPSIKWGIMPDSGVPLLDIKQLTQ